MKKQLLLASAVMLFISCNIQEKTIRKSIRHQDELLTIAQKIFSQYSNVAPPESGILNDLALTKKEKRLLKNKLNFASVKIIYTPEENYYYDVQSDSLVVFSRMSLFSKSANIVVDMHKNPLNNLPARNPDECYKIAERIYAIHNSAFINYISSIEDRQKNNITASTEK